MHPETILEFRRLISDKWKRNDDASYPLISINWRDNLSPSTTRFARKHIDGVDVDFSDASIWPVPQLWDQLNRASGEMRASARHIQGLNIIARDSIVAGLRGLVHVGPVFVNHVIDYHTRGAIPVYKGPASPAPRVGGSPYKARQRLDIIENFGRALGNVGSYYAVRRQCRILIKSCAPHRRWLQRSYRAEHYPLR